MKNLLKLINVLALLGLTLSLASFNSHAAETQSDKQVATQEHVIFQVSDDDAKKWNLTLNNVKICSKIWELEMS